MLGGGSLRDSSPCLETLICTCHRSPLIEPRHTEGQEVTMATWHKPAGRGQGLGCGETDSARPHGLIPLPWPLRAGGSVSRPPAEGAAPWAMQGEAGGVIYAGSPRHSQGPLPYASPEHQEWMNQSRLIRAFHAKPAQMTDLETAWSCSFSGFLRHAPEQTQVFIISIHTL